MVLWFLWAGSLHYQFICAVISAFENEHYVCKKNFSHLMTKPIKWHVRPAKTQISLDIRPVWLESSLSAWTKHWSLAAHWAHSEDSDQTGRMPRLIWVFAGCTCYFVGFVMRRLIYSLRFLPKRLNCCSVTESWQYYMRLFLITINKSYNIGDHNKKTIDLGSLCLSQSTTVPTKSLMFKIAKF